MRLPTQTVIQMYQDNLFRIAFSICQNREDAEDVVQETFLRYHSGAVDFNDEMHIRAWLIRVTINQSKNMLRTFWHRNRTSLEDYMERLNFSDTESQELFETVMKLPEKYRTVIHLFYYEDYSIKEIADILKISESNVKVRLNRGRTVLRDTLKEAWDYEQSE